MHCPWHTIRALSEHRWSVDSNADMKRVWVGKHTNAARERSTPYTHTHTQRSPAGVRARFIAALYASVVCCVTVLIDPELYERERVQSGCRSSEPTHTHALAKRSPRRLTDRQQRRKRRNGSMETARARSLSTAPRNGVAPAPRKTASSPLRSPTRHTATKGRVSPLLRAPRGPRPNAVEGREEERMSSSLAGQKPPLLWRRTSSSRRSCTRCLKRRTESGTPLCCLRGEAQRVERMAAQAATSRPRLAATHLGGCISAAPARDDRLPAVCVRI